MSNTKSEKSVSVGVLTAEEEAILAGLRELADEERNKTEAKEPPKANQPEFNERELLSIFDQMLTQGGYVETVSVGPRMRVAWRTRTVGEANAVTTIIDTAGFQTLMAIQNHTTLLNMAHSLVGFNGRDFSSVPFNEKKDYLDKLPEAIITQLSRSLNKFDYKISKATEVGQENF